MPHGHVLVVDDDDAVRHLLVDVLKEDATLEIDSARDGVDALHRISTHAYDLVILDVMMPHMTGIDFLDSLQALASDPSVRTLRRLPAVLVITSATPEHSRTVRSKSGSHRSCAPSCASRCSPNSCERA